MQSSPTWRSARILGALLALAATRALVAADAESACPACAAGPVDAHLSDDPWVPIEHRLACPAADLALADQRSQVAHWRDLSGRPAALTFIFSRCANPSKCPRAVAAMASLAARAHHDGIADQVHLGIVTYDPRFDSAERLAGWTAQHGVTPDLGVMLLRPQLDQVQTLVADLQLGVSFLDSGSVAAHDLELVVCDRQGRVAHHYHATIWDEAQVMNDLHRLLAEPP